MLVEMNTNECAADMLVALKEWKKNILYCDSLFLIFWSIHTYLNGLNVCLNKGVSAVQKI